MMFIRSETWGQRTMRLFAEIASERELKAEFSEEQNRLMFIADAQHKADKEMQDEVHFMLRRLCIKLGIVLEEPEDG